MTQQIKTIRLALPYHLGSVNGYLVETGAGFFLIDTGGSNQRAELEKELESAGCKPGSLKLIVLTHGDFDHIGNAAYLCHKFTTQIAMHAGDAGMLERGDMFWNRKKANALIRLMASMLFRFGKAERCTPDIIIGDGYDLSQDGFAAQVLSIPGHSRGSIGILTALGDLFCGDLLENTRTPRIGSIMDDLAEANESLEKLKGLEIHTVYPGHGAPFPWSAIPM